MNMWGILPRVLTTVTSVWIFLFLGSRILLFHHEYIDIRHEVDADRYTLLHVCAGNQAHMGRHATICEEAKRNVQVAPWQTALRRVFQQTYLCGDTPCSAVVSEFTNSLYKLAFCVILLICCPLLLYFLVQRPRNAILLPNRQLLTHYKSKKT